MRRDFESLHEESLTVNRSEIVFRLYAEPEDTPVKGNALCWGEPECPVCSWWPSTFKEGRKVGRKVEIGSVVPPHYANGAFPLVEGLEGKTVPLCAGTGQKFLDSDEKAEEEIISRLERGDILAWFSAKVECVIIAPDGTEYTGTDYLGACSYGSVRSFLQDGAWTDMKVEAYAGALAQLKSAGEKAAEERKKARTAVALLKRLPETLEVA